MIKAVFDHPEFKRACDEAQELLTEVRLGHIVTAQFTLMRLGCVLERINRSQIYNPEGTTHD